MSQSEQSTPVLASEANEEQETLIRPEVVQDDNVAAVEEVEEEEVADAARNADPSLSFFESLDDFRLSDFFNPSDDDFKVASSFLCFSKVGSRVEIRVINGKLSCNINLEIVLIASNFFDTVEIIIVNN